MSYHTTIYHDILGCDLFEAAPAGYHSARGAPCNGDVLWLCRLNASSNRRTCDPTRKPYLRAAMAHVYSNNISCVQSIKQRSTAIVKSTPQRKELDRCG